MFKRIAKKQAKQERDEELGLDEETKQVLGMHDTDTDESESESESGSGSGSGSGSEDDSDVDEALDVQGEDALNTEYLEAADDDSEDEDESDEEGLDLDDEPPMTVSEAVKNPIYVSSDPLESEIRSCIACPSKKLKNNTMVDVHLKSGTHTRRFQKFCKLTQSKDIQTQDPREITAAMDKPIKPVIVDPEGLTRRGLKRKLAREQLIKKRAIQKQIIKRKRLERLEKKQALEKQKEAKDMAEGPKDRAKDGAEKPKKKRKLEDEPASEDSVMPAKKSKVSGPDAKNVQKALLEAAETKMGPSPKKRKKDEKAGAPEVITSYKAPQQSTKAKRKHVAPAKSEAQVPQPKNVKLGGVAPSITHQEKQPRRAKKAERYFDGVVDLTVARSKETKKENSAKKPPKASDDKKERKKRKRGESGAQDLKIFD